LLRRLVVADCIVSQPVGSPPANMPIPPKTARHGRVSQVRLGLRVRNLALNAPFRPGVSEGIFWCLVFERARSMSPARGRGDGHHSARTGVPIRRCRRTHPGRNARIHDLARAECLRGCECTIMKISHRCGCQSSRWSRLLSAVDSTTRAPKRFCDRAVILLAICIWPKSVRMSIRRVRNPARQAKSRQEVWSARALTGLVLASIGRRNRPLGWMHSPRRKNPLEQPKQ
jgi:hypothetical protein